MTTQWNSRIGRWMIGISAVAITASAIAAWLDPAALLRAWLISFLFWLAISLGSMAMLMIWHLTGGRWAHVLKSTFAAAMAPLPVLALAFIPIAIGWRVLYPWTADLPEHLRHLTAWVSTPFFAFRALLYFAVWLGLAYILRSRILSGGREAAVGPSTAGLILYPLTMTFATWDWVMALGEHYGSAMFGISLLVRQIIAAIAFSVVVAGLSGRFRAERSKEGSLDVGNLLLATIMLWGYLDFSAFLIVWSGNLPAEITWYLPRLYGAWTGVAVALVATALLLPFVLLLFRGIKRRIRLLTAVAAIVLITRYIDLVWLVHPAFNPGAAVIHWFDPVALLAIGAPWLLWFSTVLGRWREVEQDESRHWTVAPDPVV